MWPVRPLGRDEGVGLSTRISSRYGVQSLLSNQLARVAVAGATSAAVDFTVFNLALVARDQPGTLAILIANTLAFACAMVVNFTLNARYSFGVRITRRSVVSYVGFTFVGLLFYNANLVWIRAVLQADDALMLNASKVAAMGLLVVWNYFGYKRFVFRDEPQDAQR